MKIASAFVALIVLLMVLAKAKGSPNTLRALKGIKHEDPKEHDLALDWCYRFKRQCGKTAADAYCRDKGYDEASQYTKRRTNEKTRCIGDHAVCDPNYHVCDTFGWIVCKTMKQVYNDPKEHDLALDWCYRFERQCGKTAADAYCQEKGYKEATKYPKRRSNEKTRCKGDHSVCDPNYHVCDTFDYIECNG